MASSLKKVIVRRFSPGLVCGYLPAAGVLQEDQPDSLALLDLHGKLQLLPLKDVKYACFVRDFNTADTAHPEGLTRKTFLGRPRTQGLWLRFTLRDGDVLEGLAALDATFADDLVSDRGVYLIPPDVRGNTQRLFVPRAAFSTMDIVGVVTTPTRKKKEAAAAKEQQPDLFSLELPPDARAN